MLNISAIIADRCHLTEEESVLCSYGAKALLHTILSTAGLLLTGFYLSRPFETLILITLFYLNQTIGGGYHAKTAIRCFVTMFVGLILSLISFNKILDYWFYSFFGTVSAVILFCFPLTLHANKKYLQGKSEFFIRRSRFIVILELCVLMALPILGLYRVLPMFSKGLILSAISRLAGKAMN